MVDGFPHGLLQLLQRLYRHVSEVARISAAYLGIAVLVSLAMMIAMPGVRTQVASMHAAWLAVLSSAPLSAVPDDDTERQGAVAAHDYFDRDSVPGDFQQAIGASPSTQLLRAVGASRKQVEALRRYIARKYRVAYDATGVVVHTAFVMADKYQLDPLLILAVIAIESRYNPFAESGVGAQGLMQVMPQVHKDKLETFGDGEGLALDPIVNMHVGSQILRDCVRRRGSLLGGLACYVGATGPSDGGYGAKVLAERRRLALAADLPLSR